MSKVSSGILLFYRGGEHLKGSLDGGQLEVLLVHPGGPFFKNKDDGSWTIPKGELDPDEDLELAARREFEEELTIKLSLPAIYLEQITQKGGKVVHAYACEAEASLRETILSLDLEKVSSMFELEWPPKSGKKKLFPEIDRATFYSIPEARLKINPAQIPFLERLIHQLKV